MWQGVCHADDPFPGVKTAELPAQLKFAELRPEIPGDTPEILRNVMTACWKLEPADRPNMEDIINMITAHSGKDLKNIT